MSGTGFAFAYNAPPSDLSYPEFASRVGSIPSTGRIPSLPMPIPHMSLMQPNGQQPLAPQRLPSIPQSMTLPSINRVPSIPTATRPFSIGGMGSLDPVLVPSVGWPAYAPGWPVPAHVSSTWSGGEQPMYGQSVGYVMPAPGWSVGPPLHLYGQSPSSSVADAMDSQAQQAAAEMEMAVSLSTGLASALSDNANESNAAATTASSHTADSSKASSSAAYNVRVSPPPATHTAGASVQYAPSYHLMYHEQPSALMLPHHHSLSALSPPPPLSSAASLDPATFHANIRSLSESTPRLRCLPTADHSEHVLFVAHCQYAQIVKRREQRRNDKRKRIKSKHKSRQAHAARRVRGSGGRFLTKEEKAALQQQMAMQQQMHAHNPGMSVKQAALHPFAVSVSSVQHQPAQPVNRAAAGGATKNGHK